MILPPRRSMRTAPPMTSPLDIPTLREKYNTECQVDVEFRSLLDALEKARGAFQVEHDQVEHMHGVLAEAHGERDCLADQRDSANALLKEISNILESVTLGDVGTAQHYRARIDEHLRKA